MMCNISLESPQPEHSNELLHDYMRGAYQPPGGSKLGKKTGIAPSLKGCISLKGLQCVKNSSLRVKKTIDKANFLV